MIRLLVIFATIVFMLIPISSPPRVDAAGIKLFVQWAKNNPRDWTLTDTGDWGQLAAKDEPVGDVSLAGLATGDALLNNAPGWVFAVNVQGVEFAWYDYYHVTQSGTDVIVTAWRDNPVLFPEGQKQADVATFQEPAFDIKVGQVNTRQSLVIYAQPDNQWWSRGCPCAGGSITVAPWTDFTPPTVGVIPGIYLSDAKWNEHLAVRTSHGWKEWAN